MIRFGTLWGTSKMARTMPGGEQAPGHWQPYARTLFGTLVLELFVIVLLILAANPYGNLPFSLFPKHAIMDTNQRYQFPAVIRSKLFDSVVVGTSTSRLLRPAALDRILGGRFANLAMDAALAWEEYRIATLFAASVPTPRTLLVGLDHVWCYADADQKRITERGFPEWMFDDDPWNDLPWMLNKKSAEIAGRRILYALGLMQGRIPFDGYEVFVPPEDQYDLVKARAKIKNGRLAFAGLEGSMHEKTVAKTYPALRWLEHFPIIRPRNLRL